MCSAAIRRVIRTRSGSAPRRLRRTIRSVLVQFHRRLHRIRSASRQGVLILAQRQAVLVAKQAASLDELSNGRLRLGVGVGWNELEFTGLNENFNNRGKRSEEQVQVMQALWANAHVDFKGKYHTIDDSGINPRPKSGRVPVWFGGHVDATLERTAKWGDGWMPLAYAADDTALAAFEKLRGLIRAAGRKQEDVGIEVWCSLGNAIPDEWRKGGHVLEERRRDTCDGTHDLCQQPP